jgi:hypothetical protein
MPYKEGKEKTLALINHYFLPTLLIVAVLVTFVIISNHPEVDQMREIVAEGLLRTVIGYGVLVCELAAMFVILVGVSQAILSFLKHILERSINKQITTSQTIRLRLSLRSLRTS